MEASPRRPGPDGRAHIRPRARRVLKNQLHFSMSPSWNACSGFIRSYTSAVSRYFAEDGTANSSTHLLSAYSTISNSPTHCGFPEQHVCSPRNRRRSSSVVQTVGISSSNTHHHFSWRKVIRYRFPSFNLYTSLGKSPLLASTRKVYSASSDCPGARRWSEVSSSRLGSSSSCA